MLHYMAFFSLFCFVIQPVIKFDTKYGCDY